MRCRQNWSEVCEKALNKHIIREYQASLTYHMLSNYFNRDDVGLNKLVEYFNKASLEEREHADKLMNYQNIRGGIVLLENINVSNIVLQKPDDILSAFNMALDLEKQINNHLLNLHKISDEQSDAQFSDYLEGEFLKEQVEAISEISKIISVIERFNGDQHGIWNYLENNL